MRAASASRRRSRPRPRSPTLSITRPGRSHSRDADDARARAGGARRSEDERREAMNRFEWTNATTVGEAVAQLDGAIVDQSRRHRSARPAQGRSRRAVASHQHPHHPRARSRTASDAQARTCGSGRSSRSPQLDAEFDGPRFATRRSPMRPVTRPRRRYATWRPSAAISCNARAAGISARKMFHCRKKGGERCFAHRRRESVSRHLR